MSSEQALLAALLVTNTVILFGVKQALSAISSDMRVLQAATIRYYDFAIGQLEQQGKKVEAKVMRREKDQAVNGLPNNEH
jgi:hypothetical protein